MARLAFAHLQSDLLSEHNVTYRQGADRHGTQSLLPATSSVTVAHVYRRPDMNPVSRLVSLPMTSSSPFSPTDLAVLETDISAAVGAIGPLVFARRRA